MYILTTATKKVLAMKKRIRAVQGGTSASKTISILLDLINRSQNDKEPKLTSIVAESIPHLKRGAIRDFKNIMTTHKYWNQDNWNVTDSVYTFETGSKIEFFSTDNADKLRGARRHRLFVNEANNVTLEAFDQLEVRTEELVYLDWNPTNEFWFYSEILPKREDVEHVILTYKDNEALSENIIKAIEQRKNNKAWWRVYGEGQIGESEGTVFSGWIFVDEIPDEAKLIYRGLDFGYTHDPTAIIDIYRYKDGYLFDEVIYRTGMSNKQIYDASPKDDILTIADNEAKSIAELKLYGMKIIAANKTGGSVSQGIQYLQGKPCYVTKNSTNIIKEYRNYMFIKDRQTGKYTNVPEDLFNHAMDAIRYGVSLESLKPEEKVYEKTYDDTLQSILYPDIGL